jgi:hypothetical protein
VALNFTTTKPVTGVGYSLDGKANVTVTSNTTLAGLSTGLHNITAYAKDSFNNTGASQTITFSLVPQPFIIASVSLLE